MQTLSSQPNIQGHLPLTESTFFILLSLNSHAKHGYAIMKDVLSLSDGRVNLSAGTLYGALKRLLEQDWIERIDAAPPPHTPGYPRKAYSLTDRGRSILNAEIARLRSLVEAARLRTAEERA
jgi:DNA-binding PadR family transcriptional regulator